MSIEFPVGTKLGQYHIEKLIGKGGMGVVYQAYSEVFQTSIALKILQNTEEENLQNFFREAKAIAQLEHPNIMRIYDIEQVPSENIYYIVTQLISGKTLEEIVRRQGFIEQNKALDYIIEAVKGLSYAHQKGIIHRDIKPGNIILDEQGHIKIMDFGLAYNVDVKADNEQSNKIMGTPFYMAPEQCQNKVLDARIDIYAIGATFYHLLAGHPPFTGSTLIEIFQKHILETPRPLEEICPNVSPLISKCIKKMLAKEPSQRYDNCEELLAELEKIRNKIESLRCPRCGKYNKLENVFDCPRCNTKNLCLSHLLPKKQYCDSCEELITELERDSIYFDFQQWLQHIEYMMMQKEGGIWCIQSKDNSLLFFLSNNCIELKTKDNSWETLVQKYDISQNISIQEQHKQAIRRKITEALNWEIKRMKIYSASNTNYTFTILPHPTTLTYPISGQLFLKMLSNVVRLYKSIYLSGGVMIHQKNRIIGLLYTRSGVAITLQEKNQQQRFIAQEQEACELLSSIEPKNCEKMVYRDAISFPPIQSRAFFTLPEKSDLDNLLINTTWERYTAYIPNVISLANMEKWSELNAKQVQFLLLSSFRFSTWINLLSSLSPLHAMFCLIAIQKELLYEVSLALIDNAQQQFLSVGCLTKMTEQIIKDAENINPDNQDLMKLIIKTATSPKKVEQGAEYLVRLGDVYLQRERLDKAKGYYECALEYVPNFLPAKLGVLDIYVKQNDIHQAKKLGMDILPQLKEEQNFEQLQNVCHFLLQFDNSLIECRKNLIEVYLQQKNVQGAIQEYEALAQFYHNIKNIELEKQCYKKIVDLSHEKKHKHEPKKKKVQRNFPNIFKKIIKHHKKRIRIQIFIWLTLIFFASFFYFQLYGKQRIHLVQIQMEHHQWEKAYQNIQWLKKYQIFFLTSIDEKIQEQQKEYDQSLERHKQKKQIQSLLKFIQMLEKTQSQSSQVKLQEQLLKKIEKETIQQTLQKYFQKNKK